MGLNINVAQKAFGYWSKDFNTRPDSSRNLNFFNFISFAGRYNPGDPIDNFFQDMENALEGSQAFGDGIDGNLLDSDKYVEKDGVIYCEAKNGSYVRMNIQDGKVEELTKEQVLQELGIDPNDGDEVTFQNGEVVIMSMDLFDSNDDNQYQDWVSYGNVARTEHNEINLSNLTERMELRDKLNSIGKDASLPNIFGNATDESGNTVMKNKDGDVVGIFKDGGMATIQSGLAYVTYHDGTDWQVVAVSQDNYMNEPFSNFVDQASMESAIAEIGTTGYDSTSGASYTKVLQFKVENGMVVAYAGKGQEILPTEGETETEGTEETDEPTKNNGVYDLTYFVPEGATVVNEGHSGSINDVSSVSNYDLTNNNLNTTINSDTGNDFYVGGLNSNITIKNYGGDDTLHLAGNIADWELTDTEYLYHRGAFGIKVGDGYKAVYYNKKLNTTVTIITEDKHFRMDEINDSLVFGGNKAAGDVSATGATTTTTAEDNFTVPENCDVVVANCVPKSTRGGDYILISDAADSSYDLTDDITEKVTISSNGNNDFYVGGSDNSIMINPASTTDTLYLEGAESDWEKTTRNKPRVGNVVTYTNSQTGTTVTLVFKGDTKDAVFQR